MKKFSIQEIHGFILKHYPRAREWASENFRNWLAWASEQGFLLLVGDETRIAGLVIARPVMDVQKAVAYGLDFDMEGDTYFIDLAVAPKPKREVLQGIGFAVIKRFGMRDKVAFRRHNVGPVIVTNAHRHRERLLRKELHYGN